MTTRSYQSAKKAVRRSRRVARQTDVLGSRTVRHGALQNVIQFAA